MSSLLTIVNGEFVPADEASLRVSDLAIQRGYGVFDVFKTLAGRAVFLDDHLARLARSAQMLRLPIEQTTEQLKTLATELVRRNAIGDSVVRITATGGYAPDGYTISRPNLIVTQRPLPDNKSLVERGLRLITYEHHRQIPEAKTIDYLMGIWLQPHLREHRADDVLYHQSGLISECPRSNIFIVTEDERLVTPGQKVLKGVIRNRLLDLVRHDLAIEERDVTLDELAKASEIFITSTTKNIVPVVAMDGRTVGDGRAGPVTLRLCERLEREIAHSLME